jgi:hypothetical protein
MSPDKEVCRSCFLQRTKPLNKYDSVFRISLKNFDQDFDSGYILCRLVSNGSLCESVLIDEFEEKLFKHCPFATEHVVSQEKKDG